MAASFFVILWRKPWVFYTPADYGDRSPEEFIGAIARISSSTSEFIARLEATGQSPISDQDKTESFVEQIKNELITIDLSEFGGGTAYVPVSSGMHVGDLLDFVYFEIVKTYDLEPFTYTKSWILADSSRRKKYRNIGTAWARDRGFARDERDLSSVGITGGAKLLALKIGGERVT